jgi:MerR family transcriptional regulator, light-induced transcriptional regulator
MRETTIFQLSVISSRLFHVHWINMGTDIAETESATPDSRYVSTAQVAKAIGVSVTTVKRWVDEGILPAHRTPGGHRKLFMTDVLRLVRQGSLPAADFSQLIPRSKNVNLRDSESIRAQLLEAVLAPDSELVKALLFGAYQSGFSMELLADSVISPVMTRIGHDWEMGRLEVMHEHRATQALMAVLYEMRGQLRIASDGDRPVAVGGAPESDHYILPSLLAKLVLLDCGWDAINLGPHTPMSAFETAIAEIKPSLLWLSVMHLEDSEKFLSDYRSMYQFAERNGIAVAVGGRGLNEVIRRQMPYTTYGDNLSQLAAFARNLHPVASRPKRGRPSGSSLDRE